MTTVTRNAVKISERETVIAYQYGNYYIKTSSEVIIYNTAEMDEVYGFTPTELNEISLILLNN